MIYMYMVLGCWLPFVFPEVHALTPLWQTIMVAAIVVYWLAIISVEMGWANSACVGDDAKFLHTRIWLPSLSGLLTGHPVIAILFAFSAYLLGAVAKEAKKKLVK